MSRFASLSPWRNLQSKLLPPYSELPISTSDLNIGRQLAASDDTIYIRSSNGTGLVSISTDIEAAGKYGSKAEEISLPASSHVCDIEVSAINDGKILVGTQDGSIVVLNPQNGEQKRQWKHPEVVNSSSGVLVRWHPHAEGLVLSASLGSPVVALWDINDTSSPVISFRVRPGAKAGTGKYVHDVIWDRNGSKIYIALADGTVHCYDPRHQSPQSLSSTPAPSFGLPKPIRLAVTSSHLIVSTLTSSRQRQLLIYTLSNLQSATQTITLDTSSHPLSLSSMDIDRNLIFMASRGDTTVRWIEVGNQFSQGSFPISKPITSITLLPSTAVDVMKAEIDRLYILAGQEVIPVSVVIPQRQLIDYHSHLFPDTNGDTSAMSAKEWAEGREAVVQKVSLDPTQRKKERQPRLEADKVGDQTQTQVQEMGAQPQPQDMGAQPVTQIQKSQPEPQMGAQPADATQIASQPTHATQIALQPADATQIAPQPTPETPSQPPSMSSVNDAATHAATPAQPQSMASFDDAPTLAATPAQPQSKAPSDDAPAPASQPALATPLASSVELAADVPEVLTDKGTRPKPLKSSSAALGTPSTATWSRTTLTGSTALLPTFSSVPAFDSSVAPATHSLLATPSHLLYQLSGPGGRLAFHEITRQGRLPEAKDISWIETGGKVLDFAYDRFDPTRILTVGEDGLKIWRLPSAESSLPVGGGDVSSPSSDYEQKIITEAEKSVQLPQVGRASKISLHPTAKDVALVAGPEGLVVLDNNLQVKKELQLQTANEAEWSPDGSLVAFAHSSGKKLLVWNPLQDSDPVEIAAHDSSRPFKICWTDESHLVTVGHMAGSMRQVKLFSVDSSDLSIKELGRSSLDTSPAVLFPTYDRDTSILYLWSKGERSVSSLHLTLGAPAPKFGSTPSLFKPLPSFQHSTPQIGISFLPKRYVNVKEVEVSLGYRLTKSNEIQKVSWKVQRKRMEYFQNDVYPATIDVETPLFDSFNTWSSHTGETSQQYLNLQPKEMQPLSSAPVPTAAPKQKVETGRRFMTEKEREDELMDSVFAKVKNKDEEEEMEDTAARRRAPDDDDWDD
ncbi:unnamed protein product [Sympodiomycopsis kandeliae]